MHHQRMRRINQKNGNGGPLYMNLIALLMLVKVFPMEQRRIGLNNIDQNMQFAR